MTVTVIQGITKYVGLSTDVKPPAAKHGSTFVEIDTGSMFIFDAISGRWRVTQARIDQTAHCNITMDISHNDLILGNTWNSDCYDVALADDASMNIALTTGASEEIHISAFPAIGGDGEFSLFERSAFDADGVVFDPIKTNRLLSGSDSPQVSSTMTIIRNNPTVTDDGGIISGPRLIPGGSGVFAGGGSLAFTANILEKSTNYVYRLTNRSGTTQVASVHLLWSEIIVLSP